MAFIVEANPGVIDRFSSKTENGWVRTCLSNGFVEPDGTHVEREYHAARAKYIEDALKILECSEPFGPDGAQELGRAVEHRDDWEQVRYQVMMRLVLRKFVDHSNLAAELLATRDALLVEGNTWHDNIWGDCRCGNPEHPECQDVGLNLLGQILMSVRESLRQFASI